MKTFERSNNLRKKSVEYKYKRRSAEEIVYDALQTHFNAKIIGEEAFKELMHYPLLCQIAYIGNWEALLDVAHRDVDFNVQSTDGSTPLIIASENGHAKIVQFLLDRGSNPAICRKDGGNAFVFAVGNGDKDVLMSLQPYIRMIDINLLSSDGETLLFVAVKKGVVEIIDLLLKTPRINVNHQRPDGCSPLMVAASKGNAQIVHLLINAGSSITMENERGETALCLAVSGRHFHIMKLMFSEMNAKSKSSFVKKRIQLLTEPKQRLSDVLPFFKKVLIPILLHTRLNVPEAVFLFQQNDIFDPLLWCAFRNMQDIELLQMIFHLSMCLMLCNTDNIKLIELDVTENFVHIGGPDLCLKVITNQKPGCNRELCNTALLPLYTICEMDTGKQWLKDHLIHLYPYIKEFNCGIPKVDYMYDGEEAKVKLLYERFAANVKEMIENSASLWDQVVVKSLRKILHKDVDNDLPNDSTLLEESNTSVEDILSTNTNETILPSEIDAPYASALKRNLFSAKAATTPIKSQPKSEKKLHPFTLENKQSFTTQKNTSDCLEEMIPTMTWDQLNHCFKSLNSLSEDSRLCTKSETEVYLNCKSIDGIIPNVNLRNIILSLRGITNCKMHIDELRRPQNLKEQVEFTYNMLASMKPIASPEDMLSFMVRQYQSSGAAEDTENQHSSLKKSCRKTTKPDKISKKCKWTSQESFQREDQLVVGKLFLRGCDLRNWWDGEVNVLKDEVCCNIADKSLVIGAMKYCLVSIMAEFAASKIQKQESPGDFSPRKTNKTKFRLFCLKESHSEILTLAEMIADKERLTFMVKLNNSSMWFQRYFNLSFVLSSMLEKLPEKTSAFLFSLHPYYTLKFGTFGSYMGIFSDGLPVVVRCIDSSMLKNKEKCAIRLKNIRTSQKDHPHLNSALEAVFCQSNMSIYVLSGACEYNLTEYLHQYGKAEKFQLVHARTLIRQLIQGMQYLHRQMPAVIHGNLKPSNILITEKNCLKISDFYFHNISRLVYGIHKNPDSKYYLSNFSWRPQELVNATSEKEARRSYGKFSDVQVIGMLICFIANVGKHPFGNDDSKCQKNITMGLYHLQEDPADPEARDLIHEMIKYNPYKRISLAQVILHPHYWSLEQRFQFLLHLQKKLYHITKKPHFVHQFLKNYCIEARNWTTYINDELANILCMDWVHGESYLDMFHFASQLNSTFKRLPEKLQKSLVSPSTYFLGIFPNFFMFMYEVLRKYKVLQRQMGIQNYFYTT